MKSLTRHLAYVLVGILVVAISACAAPSNGQTSTSATDLVNTDWSLESYGQVGFETQVIEGTEVSLQFQSGGQVVGSGGCNSYGGQYTVSNGKISFSRIASTEMACTAEGLMSQEAAFFQALQNTGEFELRNNTLTIWYNNGQSVLNFVPPEAP